MAEMTPEERAYESVTARLERIEAMVDEALALLKRLAGEDSGGRGLGH